MELSLLRKISKWVSRTKDVGRDHLSHVRLSCIVHYGQVKLNLPLLRAASNFWDNIHHVICFNRCELCPMMEEFGVIMGLVTLIRYSFLPNTLTLSFFLMRSRAYPINLAPHGLRMMVSTSMPWSITFQKP